MKILILSDSHYRNLDIDISKYDYVIHCGDYGDNYEFLEMNNCLFVRGNCDYQGPKEIFTKILNRDVLILHGDYYNVKNTYNSLVYKGIERKANFVFFGHTHRMDMFIEDNIVFINPGSYQDGNYVIIDDNNIKFYCDKKLLKSFEYRW